MKPSEIRAGLLGQHEGLRSLIAEVRQAPEKALRAELHRLVGALREHNHYEEAMLRDIIRQVDAWGPARVEIMNESHVQEHAELLAALVMLSATDRASARESVERVLTQLEAHMKREEEVVLSEDVLRDDDVVIDYFGG